MSLFTDIVQSALGANAPAEQADAQTQNLLSGALGMLESMGGIDGLMKKFQQSGLGDLAASWVGNGENKTIGAEELTQALGQDQIAALAQQAGIPESEGASVLSKILPDFINNLTPDGLIPDSDKLATMGKVVLGGIGVAVAAKAAASYFGNKDKGENVPPAIAPEIAAAKVESGSNSATAPTPPPQTYTVASGDTLSKIAKHYYQDANQWRRIYEANRDVLKDPDRIFPGQVLRIP